MGGRNWRNCKRTLPRNAANRLALNEGIEGSLAKHQTVKQYYAKIQAPTPELKTQIPPEPEPPTVGQRLAEAVGMETDHSRAEAARLEAQRKRRDEAAAQRKAEQAKAKQYEAEGRKQGQRGTIGRVEELRPPKPRFALGGGFGASGGYPRPQRQKELQDPHGARVG